MKKLSMCASFSLLLILTLSSCSSDDDNPEGGGAPIDTDSTEACEQASTEVSPESELTGAVTVAGEIQCVFFSTGPSGEPVECADGTEVYPRYRQTATISRDSTMTTTDPEIASDPCPS